MVFVLIVIFSCWVCRVIVVGVLVLFFSCFSGVICVYGLLQSSSSKSTRGLSKIQGTNWLPRSRDHHEHRLLLRVQGVGPRELPLQVRRLHGRSRGHLRRLPRLLEARAVPAQSQHHRVHQDVPRVLRAEEHHHLQVCNKRFLTENWKWANITRALILIW